MGFFKSLFNRNYKSTFYEGGKITNANRDFYNANNDFESTASPDRDTMRARARWLHENNPILANIDRTIAANVIGSGIGFQMKTDNEALNDEIELEWKFAKENLDITGRDDFDSMCSTILKARMCDGEVPIYMPFINDNGEINLKIQIIESDRFALGGFSLQNGQFYDGIEVNSYGKPISYHFQNNLFKQAYLVGKKIRSDVAIPADQMIYYYKRDNRFTQYRGISEYKQVILDIKNFSAYMRATIESARSRANIAYVIKSATNPRISEFELDLRNNPIETINGIFIQRLKQGEEIDKLDPDVVGISFSDFVGHVVRLIAVGRKVGYEMAFRDYTKVNYSSARMSWLQDYKMFDEEFSNFCNCVYLPIFKRWLEHEVLKGKFKKLTLSQYQNNKKKLLNAIKLYAPKREWVDPLKESKAIEVELKSLTNTLEGVYAKRGEDWQEALEQIARERDLMKKLGIDFRDIELVQDKLLDEKEIEEDD